MDLQINDWPMRRFILLILSIQIVFIMLSFLESIKLGIPVLKSFLGILILFLPGFVLLRILNIHEIGTSKSLIFSIGLSLCSLMFIGMFMNQIYPLIGILKPITSFNVQLTLNIFLISLISLAYIRDQNFERKSVKINYREFINPYSLLIILNLFIGILGVNLAYYYTNNFLLMVFILLTSIVPFFVIFDKIHPRMYPLVIFILSLGLMYHVSLFSPFLVGTDIFSEFFNGNLTLANNIWDSTNVYVLNSVLSITILPAIFSCMSNLSVLIYFKVLSPFIFSLVPVILFYIYEESLNITKKETFLAVFFVIASSSFYFLMGGLIRQQIAEFFYVLLIYLIINKIKSPSYTIIFLLFSFGLVFSHYSLAYVFFFFILLFGVSKYLLQKIFSINLEYKSSINLNYIFLFLVILLAWQLYVSNSSALSLLISVAQGMVNSFSEMFSPQTNFSLQVISSSSSSMLHVIYRYIIYSTFLFFFIGVIYFLREVKSTRQINYYELFSLVNFVFLGIFSLLPMVGFKFGLERLFQIVVLTIAPFMIMGLKRFLIVIKTIFVKFFKLEISKKNITSHKIIALFLCIFFLFNSGILYEVTNDEIPSSVSLSLHNAKYPTEIENTRGVLYLKIQTLSPSELGTSEWFSEHRDQKQNIFTTYGSNGLFIYGLRNVSNVDMDKVSSKYGGYFYLNYISKVMRFDVLKKSTSVSEERLSQESLDNLNKFNKIYSSTGDDIFLIN